MAQRRDHDQTAGQNLRVEMRGLWDAERRAMGQPSARGNVVRELSADGSRCRIVYAACTPDNADQLIRAEIAKATEAGYQLEWKFYGHDTPADLPERLLAAGFVADEPEDVLALPLDDASLAAFNLARVRIRRVGDERGLADYVEISREIGRCNLEQERRHLAALLARNPEEMSIHIAYVGEEPVSCGRVYFRSGGSYAELAGGRTKTMHRGKGLFTALVGSRLRQAQQRGRTHAFVDALPTSAPTLRKRGFGVRGEDPTLRLRTGAVTSDAVILPIRASTRGYLGSTVISRSWKCGVGR